MPICHNCSKPFPCKIYIDGKQRNIAGRRYCLNCSPFEKHNTRKLELPQLPKHFKVLKICNRCNRELRISRNAKECGTCVGRERRDKAKNRARSLFGNKCLICNYNRCPNALTFHHKKPEDKEFSLSSNWQLSWSQIENEIRKCILVCNRCHVELHEGLIVIPDEPYENSLPTAPMLLDCGR